MSKSETNPNSENPKPYDLEERTAVLLNRVARLLKDYGELSET
jgi:hypothetical protein